MTSIFDLTTLIREERKLFQAKIIAAEETKKQELAKLKNDYIPNTPTFSRRQEQIEKDYTTAIIDARAEIAENIADEIESLKEFELSKVGRVDSDAMAKINALKNIPMTAAELQVVLDRHGKSNYWVQRAVGALAEENGILPEELKLSAPLDTKLSVLSQLERQLDDMLKSFDGKANTPEASKARHLLLNDDILSNAEDIYNNHLKDISGADMATRSYYKVRATTGEMSRAVVISNTMRNLRNKDAKNLFLYHLSNDTGISQEALEVAGIADIITEWRTGKSEQFIEAKNAVEKIRSMKDVSEVKEYLKDFDDSNEFLPHELKKASKKSSAIKEALEGMGEQDTPEAAQEPVEQSTPGAEANDHN